MAQGIKGSINDWVGYKHNMLTVLSFSHTKLDSKNRNRRYWLVKCECGTIKTIAQSSLYDNKVISCGCRLKESRTIHGLCYTKEHKLWSYMINRAAGKGKSKKKAKYAALGIYEGWRKNFLAFLEYMGKCPDDKTSIDRIKNDIGYFPGNVRWASIKDQNRNTSQNRIIEFNGISMCVTEWAEKLNVSRSCISNRLNRNWPIEDVLYGRPKNRSTNNNPA